MLTKWFLVAGCRIHCPRRQYWQHLRPCGYCRKEDPDPDGVHLAATQEPLAEASKLVQTLLQHAQHRPRTHILAFEVNRGFVLQHHTDADLVSTQKTSRRVSWIRDEHALGQTHTGHGVLFGSLTHRVHLNTLARVACPATHSQWQDACLCISSENCSGI